MVISDIEILCINCHFISIGSFKFNEYSTKCLTTQTEMSFSSFDLSVDEMSSTRPGNAI